MHVAQHILAGTHTVWAAFQLACQQLSCTHLGSRLLSNSERDHQAPPIATGESQLRVLHIPDYRSANPYQTALLAEFEDANIEVFATNPEGAFPLIQSYVANGNPDIIHLHWIHRLFISNRGYGPVVTGILGIRLIAELLLLRFAGVSIVWTVHNLYDHERIAPRIERLIRCGCARIVHRLIVHCPEAASETRRAYRLGYLNQTEIAIIPHGNYDDFYPQTGTKVEARDALNIHHDSQVLLYFGLIRPYKNVDGLLETFRTLDVDATLLVVGNPWTPEIRTEIEQLAASDDRVRVQLAFIPTNDVSTYFQAADAIVLPFSGVLTSGSAILAMTFGRALIAPRTGCIPSLIGNNHGGISYDPQNADGLDAAITKACESSNQLHQMGTRNRRVADTLAWESIGRQTATVYTEVRNERRH